MKIIPRRDMMLDGRHVDQGKAEEVSKEEGELAIRMGWADPAPQKGKPEKTAPKEAGAIAESNQDSPQQEQG